MEGLLKISKQAEIPGKDRESEAFWKIIYGTLWEFVMLMKMGNGMQCFYHLQFLTLPGISPWSVIEQGSIGHPLLWNAQGYKYNTNTGHINCHFSLNTCRTTNRSVILRLHEVEKSRKCRSTSLKNKFTGHNCLEWWAFAWWMVPKGSL